MLLENIKKSAILDFIDVSCDYFEIEPQEIVGARYNRTINFKRAAILSVLSDIGFTHKDIAVTIGKRSFNTVVAKSRELIRNHRKKNKPAYTHYQELCKWYDNSGHEIMMNMYVRK